MPFLPGSRSYSSVLGNPTSALSLVPAEETQAVASLMTERTGIQSGTAYGGAPFTFWKVLLYDARHCSRPSGWLVDKGLY